MIPKKHWSLPLAVQLLAVLFILGRADAAVDPTALEHSFEHHVKPFLNRNCVRCHNTEKMKSGVRVDHLNASLEDSQVRLWEVIEKQISDKIMPPEDEPQPTNLERERMAGWIQQALEIARSRPAPKNGSVRRLTVAQYRNTLRELLLLEDDLADSLPPDAVSRDGFSNNQETLQSSPLLLEAYYEIAEAALSRCIVDPKSKPIIQNFRVDLGKSINSQPCPDKLILGADSLLLNNTDFTVSQLTPVKPFDFEPFFMRTKFRFIEGYQGNDTVRGWREYGSIYHAVFACMRGNGGYPKGQAYSTVPQGLLLRPAIPSAELFEVESTYGPKANFKISLRELPDHGRFRVTITAAKYDDGLLLDPLDAAQSTQGSGTVICRDPGTPQSVTIPDAGIYQVDVYRTNRHEGDMAADSSRLTEGLVGAWLLDGNASGAPERQELEGRLMGGARFVDSPFGQGVMLGAAGDSVVVSRHEAMNVGNGDFTVTAWIHPLQPAPGGIASRGKQNWSHGWFLDLPDDKGVLRFATVGPDHQSNGTVSSPPGTIVTNTWQHVAAVVRRGDGGTRLYVNGYAAARGTIGPANLDNPQVDLHLGRLQEGKSFRGELDEVRIHRRALDEAEIQALIEPGRRFVKPPPPEEPKELMLFLGSRHFSGKLTQPAFLAVRLPAGPLPINAEYAGVARVDRIVFTPLPADQGVARRFSSFEKRSPQLGLHMGLRRDCGSTLAPVGAAQVVSNLSPARFVFEGAIRNFPSPDVEKDNVNYLAGVREIGVRSEYSDGRDMPRLLIRFVEFEGPCYESWPPPLHRNIFIDFERKDDLPAYAREIIRNFAARAYRRPVTAAEASKLMAVFEESYRTSANFEESVKDVLQVALTSPPFLFLIENSATPEPEPLDDYELVSKLSYFLWNGPPDSALLHLAATGTLQTQLDAEVARMIEHPRFSRFISEFTSQWLALDKFNVLESDRSRFPRLTRDTRAQLRQEPVQFLQYLIRKNLSVRHLVESDVMIANEVVAAYYDLADKTESGFQFVPVQHGRRELGGLLTQAAIMAGLSDGRESNPVKRGTWLARRIIGEPPDDPPPNVPALKEETRDLSLRERIERHRNQPGCAKCHSKIDPWGIPFEEFDAGGRLKQQVVDARSTLPDKTEVAGVNDLKRYLAQDRIDQVAFSFLRHLVTYATGRSLSYSEIQFLKEHGAKLKANGYRMQDMIRFVVHSPMFLEK